MRLDEEIGLSNSFQMAVPKGNRIPVAETLSSRAKVMA